MYQRRVFSPALTQNIPHAVEHSLHGGEVVAQLGFFSFNVSSGFIQRRKVRLGKQLVGQWFDASLACHLPLGATFLLERQIDIFKVLFGGGMSNGCRQHVRQLALLTDAVQHGFLAVGQLTQIAQALLQFPQLNVVEPAGGFFAVARNKRHGGAAVQQFDSGVDLVRLNTQFLGNLGNDG